MAVSVDRLGEDIDTCLPGLTNQTGYRLRWFLRLVYSRATQGAKGVSFGVCLPKHHAEAGRVSLYEGYFCFTGFASPSQGAKAGHGLEKEASSACRETQHHIGKRVQSFLTAHGQAKSQRASKLGRLDGDRQQVPSTWRWVLASARDLNSHRRTSCLQQPVTRAIRGRGNVHGCIGRVRCPISAKWPAQAHSHGFVLIRNRCLDGDIR